MNPHATITHKKSRLSMKYVAQVAREKGYHLGAAYGFYEVWSLKDGRQHSRLFIGTLKECYLFM